jgi:hypothetical protein
MLREYVREYGRPFDNPSPQMMSSEDIKFSQDTIKPNFKDGRSVAASARQLVKGPSLAERIPPIKVVVTPKGTYAISGNRRLAAAKLAGVGIKVQSATPAEIEGATRKYTSDGRRFTSQNDGKSIRVSWSTIYIRSSTFQERLNGRTGREAGRPSSGGSFIERLENAFRSLGGSGKRGNR